MGQQFGVWPKKAVPDVLRDDIFGKRWAYSYALVDAARVDDLAQRLEDHTPRAQCLFDGQMAEVASSSSPWLIEIADNDRFTRSLFTAGDRGSGLWDAKCGLILRSDLPLERVRANFRKITQFYDDESGKQVFLRFWDPLYARYLLSHGSTEMRLRLLRTGPMMMRGAETDEFLIWSLPDKLRDLKSKSPFRLHAMDRYALKVARLDDFVTRVLIWMRSSYGSLPCEISERRFVLELSVHARDTLGLKTERTISDYVAASWLLRAPAERRLDMRPLRHEIPQATLARIHDIAYDFFKASS
ncbi:DUF4123 domain-containing protein [Paracoccus lutimaris]|nr:DUF4123 domain-containing protein [Paracoccus lutimaris]